ncbi:MAG: phage portal protein [Lachnospiraceae bacterium]|nr:phage portal protein [Lachnospiraceae bacterium]
MSIFNKSKKKKRDTVFNNQQSFGIWLNGDEDICVAGYTSLDKNPEVMTACHRIAQLIGSITIHLMSNEKNGDVRIVNELSRAIDINPMPTMTRSHWMETIVMNLLLYGEGNSIVWAHTWDGLLRSLEPIAASRVQLIEDTLNPYRDYKVLIDGQTHLPENILHFVYNPDKYYLWKGQGVTVSLKDVAEGLRQADATKKGFMKSKWKPSLIVKVDAMTEEFSGVEGRKKLREDYLETGEAGAPWIIPAQQFEVQEVRPLSLSDLAISDTVQIDKRAIASILGVPPFLIGVGEYNKEAWNSFIQNMIRPICVSIAQELTKKLILNPKWYLKFNVRSLMDWDLKTLYDVYGGLTDRGIVTGNETRSILGMSPLEGLDELTVLENYLPLDMLGMQKKLNKNGGSND